MGRIFVDDDTGEDKTDSGTHLIVFPYDTECDKTSFTSNPAIINYYRQFFMRLDEKIIDTKDSFRNIFMKNATEKKQTNGFFGFEN